jgi:ubiquinone/menaquinone biosynthesis C-methylase UbiE
MNDPNQNVSQLGLQPGMHVADIGAGGGYYVVAAGKLVGKEGRVFAIDVQKEVLTAVQEIAKQHHLMNVKAVWGNAEKVNGTRLRDNSIDAVIVANTLFQIDDHDKFATEVARICRPDGNLLLVDWNDSHGGLGPPADEVVDADTARRVFEKVGFSNERDIEAGDHHYGFIMRYTAE